MAGGHSQVAAGENLPARETASSTDVESLESGNRFMIAKVASTQERWLKNEAPARAYSSRFLFWSVGRPVRHLRAKEARR